MNPIEIMQAAHAKQESLLMENWYPILEKEGLPQPKTTFFELPNFWPAYIEDGCINGWQDLSETIKKAVWKRLCKQIRRDFGYSPVFFKTSTYSNKHYIKTLRRPGIEDIVTMYYDGIGVGAIPSLGFRFLAIREFIEIEGKPLLEGSVLPIGVERRIFLKDGQVTKVLPYWPKEAFKTDITAYLEKLNAVPTPEWVLEMAAKAGQALTKEWPSITEWSVDFALDKNGKWWLIDTALAEKSWGRDA